MLLDAAIYANGYLLNTPQSPYNAMLMQLRVRLMPRLSILDDVSTALHITLVLAAIGITAGLGRFLMEVPAELVAACSTRELYLACRRSLACTALAVCALLLVVPTAVQAALELLPQGSAVFSAAVTYYASVNKYDIPGEFDLAYHMLAIVLLFAAAAAYIPLRWPRLPLYMYMLLLAAVLPVQAGCVSAALDLVEALWHVLRGLHSVAIDVAGFVLLAALIMLPALLLWLAGARPPRDFAETLAK